MRERSRTRRTARTLALVALVCVADDDGHWRGFWTFDRERVRDVESFLVDTYRA